MKKKIVCLLTIIIMIIGVSLTIDPNLSFSKILIEKINFLDANVLVSGEYVSTDGKTLVINSNGTATYQGTYSLTVASSDTGHKITGKIGTDNKAATFYQLNETYFVSGPLVEYTHNSATECLSDYTVFKLKDSSSTSTTGNYEVWTSGAKVASFNSLQQAVDTASPESIIKITSNLKVNSGAYINKNITIDGLNNTLDKSSWANPLFVIEKDTTVNIKNLTVDGGASGFKVDYEAITFKDFKIPLVSDSDTNDFKQNTAVILSNGNLTVNNISMNNNYTAVTGSSIYSASGSLTINNSNFNHNRATTGGAVAIGANLNSADTEYPVKNLFITNSTFSENYSSNGGAIHLINTSNFSIENTKFLSNTVNEGYGGALYINKQSTVAEKRNIPYVQGKINNSVFDNNWCGNDGAAVQNRDAELTTTNTKFTNNVGVHPTSSVATFSQQVDRTTWATEYMADCYFANNKGCVAGIADHGGHMVFTVEDTTFTKNNGKRTCYFLTSIINLNRCSFIEENVASSVIEAASYSIAEEYVGTEYSGPKTTIRDGIFENNAATDIFIRQREYTTKYDFLEYTLEIVGTISADVEIWDSGNLVVTGDLTGDIVTDAKTTTDDITISDGGSVQGEITIPPTNAVRTIIRYSLDGTSNMFGYQEKVLFLETNKTYTQAEIFELCPINNDGHEMKLYTNEGLTTEWNYTPTENIVLYAGWIEHTHTYNSTLGVVNNIIGYQCECGQIDETRILGLRIPANTTYDGTPKEIIIDNSLKVSTSDYKLQYFANDKAGGWKEISSPPTSLGYYKAKLTHNGLTAEITFNIVEKNTNPNTNSNTKLFVEIMILSILGLISVVSISTSFKRIAKQK